MIFMVDLLTEDEIRALDDTEETSEKFIQYPWTSLINTAEGEYATAEEMLRAADLDWEVGFTPMYRPEEVRYVRRQGEPRDPYIDAPIDLIKLDPEEKPRPGEEVITKEEMVVSDYRDVRRLDRNLVLGTVKGRYSLLQNREAFQFADNLVDSSSAKYVGAGQQRDGRSVILVMKLMEGTVELAGEDLIEKYLLLTTGHDGWSPLSAAVIPFRLTCENALPVALPGAKWRWTIKHNASMKGRIEEARRTLNLSLAYDKAWDLEMRQLMDITVSEEKARKIVEKSVTYGTDRDNIEPLVDGIMATYNDSQVNGYQGTGYGLLQGITEHFDHVVTRRGLNSRYESITQGWGEAFKTSSRAAQLLAIN